jgi:ABC-type transporter Mla MlaB component
MKTTTKRKREAAGDGRTARARVAAEPIRAAVTEKKPAPRKTEAPMVVALPGHCCVKDAAALKQTLCKVAHESATVTVDVAALERIDTAAMQLLCAFVRDRATRDQNVGWSGTSQALDEAARLLGVSSLLAPGTAAHPVEVAA